MFLRTLRSFLVVFGSLAFAAASHAADAPAESYEVGLAKVDVTPAYPIRLSGYNNRTEEVGEVAQPLWAKALAVRAGKDAPPVVLLTVDSIGVSGDITEAVAARLLKSHGLARERLAVCSSHTHSGPSLPRTAPLILAPPTPTEHIKTCERYAAELTTKLGDVAEKALADLRPARVAHAVGKVTFAINRRVYRNGTYGLGIQPDGVVDEQLPVLFVYEPGPENKLRSVLINYACHCTTLGGKFMQMHGDWVGCFMEQWEREHPGTTAMASIGCGADANPEPRADDLTVVRQHGDDLVREVKRLLKTPQTPLSGTIEAAREVFPLPLAKLPTREEFAERAKQKGPIAYHAKLNGERLDRGEKLPTTIPYEVQSWCFGNALAMVFLPGEVVVDYQLRLKRELDGKRLWVNAYANAMPAYIPSRRVLTEGGYEVDGSRFYYDVPQRFAPEVEATIIDRVHAIVPRRFDAATRFLGEIEKIEARNAAEPPPTSGILFIGSSTIRMWKLDQAYPNVPTINHGFGGSYISDSIFFFDRLVAAVKPRQIVFYAGGNDIASGKTPAEVCRDFESFAALVRKQLPETRLLYIATAPNPKRWSFVDKTRAANRLIESSITAMQSPLVEFLEIEDKLLNAAGETQPELYLKDQLHLNEAGYKILSAAVMPRLK